MQRVCVRVRAERLQAQHPQGSRKPRFILSAVIFGRGLFLGPRGTGELSCPLYELDLQFA